MRKKLALIGEIPAKNDLNSVYLLGVWQEMIEATPGTWSSGVKTIRDQFGNLVTSIGDNKFMSSTGELLTLITPPK